MTLPLSKTYDPADLLDLAEELVVVDQHFGSASPQHEARRWEYALALRAIDTWEAARPKASTLGHLVDVGGGGSPFWRMTAGYLPMVIDPVENSDLSTYLWLHPPLADVVTCLSVLEHVEDLDRFLYHLGCLVAPGGLLFLTMDCIRGEEQHGWPEDTAHFHWDRKRIFNDWARGWLWATMAVHQFTSLGDSDFVYHGDQLYTPGPGGYSLASLALVRRS